MTCIYVVLVNYLSFCTAGLASEAASLLEKATAVVVQSCYEVSSTKGRSSNLFGTENFFLFFG